jgi:molybdenum cofactor cytidylyltransferase
VLHKLQELSALNGWALLIEADGSRQRPLKAPDDAEPCIPPFVELVAVMVGLSGLGKSVSEAHIHRPQRFSELSGLNRGTAVTVEGLAKVLKHSDGGLKNIPLGARRVVVLNQAETRERQSQGRALASMLLPEFDAVVIASLVENAIYAVHEPSAGIVLAAGEARRFGQPKQLLQWEGMPMVRAVTTIALGAGLSPVVVVTGASAEAVGRCVADLPVQVARNEGWADGQASSIRTGLSACPGSIGSAVFLLADQPRITPGLIHGLIDMHAAGLDPIVAPLILEERRGNPVLFDRRTFKDLRELHGDEGGRGIFGNYRVQYLPWHDPTVLLDIDTPEDYSRSMWEAR